MGKSLVKKSNSLIRSKYNLSLNEQRVLLLTISQIKRSDLNDRDKKYLINLKDIGEEFILMEKKRIEGFLLKLKSKSFKVEDIENRNNYNVCSWFDYIKYYGETRQIEIRFDEVITPYLFQLKKESGGKFTSYFLDNIMKFKSSYSIRIYELLMIVKGTKHKSLKFNLEKLYFLLEIPKSQQIISNFKKDILERVVKDINEFSDIFITYQFIKNGRSFTDIKFSFITNSKYEKNYYSDLHSLEKRLKTVLEYESMEYYNNEWYVDNIVEEYIEKSFVGKRFILNIDDCNDIFILKSIERFENKYKDREVYNEDGSLFIDDINTTKHLYYVLYVERLDYYSERLEQFEKLIDLDYFGQDLKENIEKDFEYKFDCDLNDSRNLYYFLNKYLVDTNI